MSPTLTSHATLSAREVEWLEQAETLAGGGWGRVHPNPMVGCVIVRDGKVVGEGCHEYFGGPHAEIGALEAAGARARGGTAYVSMEPCNHRGKTPPCAPALVAAGIARVVYGAGDPGIQSARGNLHLSSEGVEVVGPVYTQVEARRRNPIFFHNTEERSTYVALKLAVSLDGYVAAAPGERTTLTGPLAQEEVHRLRAGFDAIMVGSTTALTDDPLLTVRGAVTPRVPPTRLILDTTCKLTPSAALFRDIDTAPLLIFTSEDADESSVAALEAAGANVLRVPRSENGLDLPAVMDACGERGIRAVLCEGGAKLASALTTARIARRFYMFVAPVVLGENGVPAFPNLGPADDPRRWDAVGNPTSFGDDVLTVLDRGQ